MRSSTSCATRMPFSTAGRVDTARKHDSSTGMHGSECRSWTDDRLVGCCNWLCVVHYSHLGKGWNMEHTSQDTNTLSTAVSRQKETESCSRPHLVSCMAPAMYNDGSSSAATGQLSFDRLTFESLLSKVEQQHLDLTPVVLVNHTRSDIDEVFAGQARAGGHSAICAWGCVDGNACADQLLALGWDLCVFSTTVTKQTKGLVPGPACSRVLNLV